MTTMTVPSRMYLFNNPNYRGRAWTWLHAGCNDRAQVTFEGTLYQDIVSKACTCFRADSKRDEWGAFLKSVTLWMAADVKSTEDDVEPVITRNMDHMIYSLSDRNQWVDPSTLPGADGNLEYKIIMQEFREDLARLGL